MNIRIRMLIVFYPFLNAKASIIFIYLTTNRDTIKNLPSQHKHVFRLLIITALLVFIFDHITLLFPLILIWDRISTDLIIAIKIIVIRAMPYDVPQLLLIKILILILLPIVCNNLIRQHRSISLELNFSIQIIGYLHRLLQV